jgi:hypothetical protein
VRPQCPLEICSADIYRLLCVTRKTISKPDVLRNYISKHPTQENYICTIWEAASATAAAPLYFKSVQFAAGRESWCDGGLHRNNPVEEALAEIGREVDWKYKEIGCLLSVGTGVPKLTRVSDNLAKFLKGSVAIMTDSEETANVFADSPDGSKLINTNRYFRFSVPQGLQELELDECRKIEEMNSLTTDYLRRHGSGDEVQRCARSLLYPDENRQ